MRTKFAPGIHATGFAGQETARHNRHIILLEQTFSEFRVGDRGAQPEVERRIGHGDIDDFRENRERLVEFLAVQAAVLAHVLLVLPGSGAGGLDRGLIAQP